MHDFETYRPLLFTFAYLMTGSASDAEDILQDLYIAYATAVPDRQAPALGYLLSAATRLCLERVDELRWRRDDYLGPWLPEPLLTSDGLPWQGSAAGRHAFTLAFLTALDALASRERAAYLLAEVFGLGEAEIAAITGTMAEECRALITHARASMAHVVEAIQRTDDPETQRAVVRRFLAAVLKGDEVALKGLLADDVTYWADAGGKVVAATRPVSGRDSVARLLLGLLRQAPRGATFTYEEINAGPALVCWLDGDLLNVVSFDVAGGRVYGLRALLNADKLTYLRHQMRVRTAASR